MGRFALVAVLLAVLVTAAGCYSDPAPVTRAPTAAPSSASPPPSPPPPVSVADLTSWVEHARLTPDVVGAPDPAVERSGTEPYTAPCKTAIVANSYLVYSHYAYWIGTRIDNVVHNLFAFSALYGKEAV